MSGSANWSLPINTSNYSLFIGQVKGRDEDIALGFDPAYVTPTNVPTNTIRWNSASNRWEKYSGSNWPILSSSYNITVTNAAAANNASYLAGNAPSYFAPINSPTFTGDPKAPTPATSDNDTSIATTQFVKSVVANYSTLASPTFTGDPKAPTPTAGDNDTSIATTAFVHDAFQNRAVSGVAVNLRATNNSAAANNKIDVTADYITVCDSGGNSKLLSSWVLVVDITSNGANGLDTGTETNSVWYYVWAIAKEDNTKAGLISTSSTSPTMPSGYTYKALVSAVRNNTSSNFLGYIQLGPKVFYSPNWYMGQTFSQTEVNLPYTSFLDQWVPPIAPKWDAILDLSGNTDANGGIAISGNIRWKSGVNHLYSTLTLYGLASTRGVYAQIVRGEVPLTSNGFYAMVGVGVGSTPLLNYIIDGFSLPILAV